MDLIEDTAKGIQRYGVREFPAEMRAMADAVVEAAAVLREGDAVPRFGRQGSQDDLPRCASRSGRSKDAPTSRSTPGSRACARSSRAGEIDTIGYIDRKELYELVEDVVDKCDDVANAIQTITAKHV